MKKILLTSLFALATVISVGAHASESDQADGTARVKVRKALKIQESQVMDFATVTLGTGSSTVSIDNTGAVSTTNNTYVPSGTGSAGSFDIVGPDSQALTVTYTDGTLANTSGDTIALTVDGVTGNATSVTTDSIGNANLTVVGNLAFTGNEPNDDYSTENTSGVPYTVTVSY